MNCPKCATMLTRKYYKGMIDVDYCPNCRGMWLDFDELDQLEDVAFDEDEYKGSLVHSECDVDCKCPVCGGHMHEFLCPENHGFWLDAGEDERVIEIMRSHRDRINRKKDAETEWKHFLKGLHSFFTKA